MIRFAAEEAAASTGFFSDGKNWIYIGFGVLFLVILILLIAVLASRSKKKRNAGTPTEELWHDRKRILGLPLSLTRYWIDHDRFYIKTGLFNREINEILLYRILDIQSKRNFGQILCGVGTITLFSADQSNRTIKVENIRKPTKVHRFLSEVVERERIEHGIAGREMYGSASIDMDHVDGTCDTGEHELHNVPPVTPQAGSGQAATPPPPLYFDDMK